MGFALFLLFVAVPVLEIAVFIQLGGLIGLWPTLAGIVATAVIGVALLRHQGFAVMHRAIETTNAGQMPVAEVFDGFCLVVAGAFLLTPGFVTDAAGFALLIPGLRRWLRKTFGARLVRSGRVHVTVHGETLKPGGGVRPRGRGPVIDAEYETLSPEPEPPARPEDKDGQNEAESRSDDRDDPDKTNRLRPPGSGRSSPWTS